MTMPAAEVQTGVGPYDTLLGQILDVMDTLPPVSQHGSFCGGIVLKAATDYLVVILLPPCDISMRRMGLYLGQHHDTWELLGHEFPTTDLEVVHVNV